MSVVFVDTSALYALIAVNDPAHTRAARVFERMQSELTRLVSSSYVLVESYALVGRRLGPKAVSAFRSQLAPLLQVEWVDLEIHEQALDILERSQAGDLSLVDASSFAIMRQRGIRTVFAFDAHFEQAGFPAAA